MARGSAAHGRKSADGTKNVETDTPAAFWRNKDMISLTRWPTQPRFMNTMNKFSLAMGVALVLLLACTPRNPHPMPMEEAIQNAKTKADHEELAAHYEQAAEEMRQKADEHQKLLDRYLKAPYMFGKQAVGFKPHCETLIDLYTKAADENLAMAKLHREIAEEIR